MFYIGWTEPADTNAPVEDEAVQAVLRMNKKHILLARNYRVFSTSYLPQKFSLPPTYLPPTSPPPTS
jgi:hypothetical protein